MEYPLERQKENKVYSRVRMDSSYIVITVVVLFVSAFFLGIYGYKDAMSDNIFRDKNLIKKNTDLPVIWLYYDNSDVNSRWWPDFGARSSRAINVPFLNLCYKSITEANHGAYRVEVISGLGDAALRLGGWSAMPQFLQNPLAPVGNAELNWLRAEFLSRFGGLWVSPSVISLKPFPKLEKGQLTFFGTDRDETYAGKNGTAVPSFLVMGIAEPGDSRLEGWAAAARERIESGSGGKQIRGDAKWDYLRFAVDSNVVVHSKAELSRKKNGKRIELEDLLAAGGDGELTFDLTEDAVYTPIPWDEIQRRSNFGWFLRMNEDQILDSDLAISELFRVVN
jgi:hypothetical protein